MKAKDASRSQLRDLLGSRSLRTVLMPAEAARSFREEVYVLKGNRNQKSIIISVPLRNRRTHGAVSRLLATHAISLLVRGCEPNRLCGARQAEMTGNVLAASATRSRG